MRPDVDARVRSSADDVVDLEPLQPTDDAIEEQCGLVLGGGQDEVLGGMVGMQSGDDLDGADFRLSPSTPASEHLGLGGAEQELALSGMRSPERLDLAQESLHDEQRRRRRVGQPSQVNSEP